MYDELVKRLRAQAVYLPEKFSKNAELLDVLMKAADAIEELQKRVPKTPHGRLIDKDALEADISASVVFSGRDGNAEIVGAKKIINRLHVAPTVIEAEEVKES